MTRPPNLLFIFTDQQRRDTLGCYGNPVVQTPNLDRLAAESVVFDRAYCAQPVCTPSRSSLLTGHYPHTTGCVSNNIPLRPEARTLAELVSPDYRRAYVGKWHLGDETTAQHGFDTWISTEDGYLEKQIGGVKALRPSTYHDYLISLGYQPDSSYEGVPIFTRRATAALPEQHFRTTFVGDETARLIREAGDQPFVIYAAFQEPHPPYLGPLDDLYPPESVPVGPTFHQPPPEGAPQLIHTLARVFARGGDLYGEDMATDRAWRKTRAKYLGLSTLVDRSVGRILQALDETGQRDNTVIVFTSDHGDMVGDHGLWGKAVLYEASAGIPLIIRAPGANGRPRRVAEPFSQIDLVPTLLDLLGQPVPEGLHGRSRAGVVAGGESLAGSEAVVEWNGTSGHERHKSWKNLEPLPAAMWERVRGPRRSLVSAGGYKLNLCAHDRCELYDLNADPHEQHNLFERPEHRERLQAMAARLRAWQQHTDDAVELPTL